MGRIAALVDAGRNLHMLAALVRTRQGALAVLTARSGGSGVFGRGYAEKTAARKFIEQVVKDNDVALFMKGTPRSPMVATWAGR